MPLSIRPVENGVQFPATIQPRASRNEISGIHNNTLKLRLTSPPVDGAANKLCVKFMAKTLGVAPSCVSIVSGAASRNKVLEIDSMDEATLLDKLRPFLEERASS